MLQLRENCISHHALNYYLFLAGTSFALSVYNYLKRDYWEVFLFLVEL